MKRTIVSLVVGYHEIRWVFEYRSDAKSYWFDTKPVKEILGDIPFSDPNVIRYIKRKFKVVFEPASQIFKFARSENECHKKSG